MRWSKKQKLWDLISNHRHAVCVWKKKSKCAVFTSTSLTYNMERKQTQGEQKQEWHTQVIKWQEVYHEKEYNGRGNNNHTYKTLEHEAIVLFDKNSGMTKIIKHTDADVLISGVAKSLDCDKQHK